MMRRHFDEFFEVGVESRLKSFEESKHPRGDDGKWSSLQGSGARPVTSGPRQVKRNPALDDKHAVNTFHNQLDRANSIEDLRLVAREMGTYPYKLGSMFNNIAHISTKGPEYTRLVNDTRQKLKKHLDMVHKNPTWAR